MEGLHLISGLMATLAVVAMAAYYFLQWGDLMGEDLPTIWQAVAGIAVLMLYVSLLWRAWGTGWGYPVLLLPLVVLVALGPARRWQSRRHQGEWLERDLARCRRLLEFDPQNHGAYEEMARLHQGAGDYDSALEAIERALQLAPHEPAYRHLQRRLLEAKERLFRPCPHCGAELRREARRCPECSRRVPPPDRSSSV